MTVGELIEKLNILPKDLIVTDGTDEITSLTINDEWYNGDSANPKNIPIRAVVVS